jgi:hypothetical protein
MPRIHGRKKARTIQSMSELNGYLSSSGPGGIGVLDDGCATSTANGAAVDATTTTTTTLTDESNNNPIHFPLPFLLLSNQGSSLPPLTGVAQSRRQTRQSTRGGLIHGEQASLGEGVHQIISFTLEDTTSEMSNDSSQLVASVSYGFDVSNEDGEEGLLSTLFTGGHDGMIGDEQLVARLAGLEATNDLMDQQDNVQHLSTTPPVSAVSQAILARNPEQAMLACELLLTETVFLGVDTTQGTNSLLKIPEGVVQSEEATTFLMELYYLFSNTTGVPRGFFDTAVGIIHKHRTLGVSLDMIHFNEVSASKIRLACSRSVQLSSPQQVIVPLETSRPQNLYHHRLKMESTTVPFFNIKELFLRKLSDRHLFGTLSNLVVNPVDRWNQCSFDAATRIGEIIPAKACQEYIRQKGLVTGVDFVIPITMYGDEIQVNLNGRMGINPVSIAFGIISCALRHTDKHAETVGYIPTTDKRTKAQKKLENQTIAGRGRGARNFHSMNTVIMAQVKELQDYLARNPVWVQLGNEARRVFVHAPLLMYLGDAKAMDLMAGRYGSYSQAKRISRYCDCSSEFAGIPGHLCNKFLVQHVRPFVETIYREGATNQEVKYASAYLHSIGTHKVLNSLWDVDTGLQSALPLPHDPMHIFSQIMKLIFQLLVAPLSNTEKVEFDLVVEEMFRPIRSGEKKNFPRTFFSFGITHVPMLTAVERTGTLVMVLMLATTDRGKAVLKECLARARARSFWNALLVAGQERRSRVVDQDGKEEELPPTNAITVENLINVVEDILMLQAFCAYGHNPFLGHPNEGSLFLWRNDPTFNEGRLLGFISRLQRKLITYFPRDTGTGWAFQKFHELLHFPGIISSVGMMMNSDCAWGERLLKRNGKRPGRTVLKQYDNQMMVDVALRLHEDRVLAIAIREAGISSNDTPEDEEHDEGYVQILEHGHWEIQQRHHQWTMSFNRGILSTCRWVGRMKEKSRIIEMPQFIIEHLTRLSDVSWQAGTCINGYTEMVFRDDRMDESTKVRCHPQFRGAPFFDYCLVNFYPDTPPNNLPLHPGLDLPGKTPSTYFPCRLLAIFDNPDYKADEIEHWEKNPSVYCMVHAGEKMVSSTKLTEQWLMEYKEETISLPPLDENLNLLQVGENTIQAYVPITRLIHPSQVCRRIFVCQEYPLLRSYIKKNTEDSNHATHIAYIRDRHHYWSNILGVVVDNH